MTPFYRNFSFFLAASTIFTACSILPASPSPVPVIATLQPPAPVETREEVAAPLTSTDPKNESSFRIGLMLPFTGPLSYLGEGYKLGITLALEEEMGTIEGKPVELIVADTGGTPEGTIQSAKALIETYHVNLMIGPGTSPEAMAVIPIATNGQTPLIDATSTSPLLLEKMGENGSQWYFRINGDEKILATAFSRKIAEKNKSIAIIAEDTKLAKDIATEYEAQFKALGLQISLEEFISPTETEYRPVLFRTRQSRPDAIFLIMSDSTCAIFMRQYKNSFTTIPIYSRGACATLLFNQIIADDPDIGKTITEVALFSELQDKDLETNFLKQVGQPLTGHRMAGYYAMKYTVIPALRDLVESEKEISPENIRESIKTLKIQTPIGLLDFDKFNQAYLDAALLTNKNGLPKFIGALHLK